MVSHAIDDVEDAFSATKAFLLPVDWSRWWRLAVIALFVASANGASGATSSASTAGSIGDTFGNPAVDPPAFVGFEPFDATIPPRVIAILVAVVVAAVIVGLLFAVVAATMQFVMVEALRTEDVHLRRYVRRYWPAGLRLFGFQLGFGLVTAATFAVLVGLVAVPVVVLDSPLLGVLAALIAVPLLIVAVVLAAGIIGFTNAFVVPTMVLEERGVLAGWRRFWPVVRANWGEYLAFALVYVVLLFLAGVVVSIAATIAAILLLIPFGIIGAAAFALSSVVPAIGIPVFAAVVLLYLTAVFLLISIAQVPVVTYFRYYGLFVLGDTDPDLDLIGNRRRAVRSGPDGDPTPTVD